VVYASTGAGFSDLYVGVADGIFAKHGLKVTPTYVSPTSLIAPLLSGSAQIAGGVADGAAAAILKGEGLKFVALSEGTYNLQLWVTSGIKTMQQLAGKTIGLVTAGSEGDVGLTALLREHHMSTTSVQRDYLVTAAEQISAIRSGAVAGVLMQPPNAQSLVAAGDHVLVGLQNLPYAVGAYSATSSYVQQHPTVIKKFVAAETANLAFLRSHPTQALAAIQKYSGDPSVADSKIAYTFFLNVWKKDATITPSLIQDAFTRAATKLKVSAPTSVSKYIFTP
jgi:NitT/TauT family transport system substrate-binding protein